MSLHIPIGAADPRSPVTEGGLLRTGCLAERTVASRQIPHGGGPWNEPPLALAGMGARPLIVRRIYCALGHLAGRVVQAVVSVFKIPGREGSGWDIVLFYMGDEIVENKGNIQEK